MKVYYLLVALFIVFSLITNLVCAQKNSGFESGIEGWEVYGKVSIEKSNRSYKGNYCVKLESPEAEVLQRVNVDPYSIVQLTAFAKTSREGILGHSFIRFYDDLGNLLAEFEGNPFSAVSYMYTGYYTLAPAKTKYATYGILNTGEGIIYADEIALKINIGENEAQKEPIINIDQYLQPFWESDTIYNETVLLLSENGSNPYGKLLFNPTEIISVNSFDLKTTYSEGPDYTISKNIITKVDGSGIPSRADTSFSKKDLSWYNLQSQWVVVTYLPKDRWNGIVPVFKGDDMPNTLEKLISGTSLKIVACGMSITRGMDVSGYHNIPPYMPSYYDLFVHQLKKRYGYNDIKLYNAGLPGGYIDWAAQYADLYINALNPDLVIIDFGMNDFWKYTPDQFKNQVETIINKCKAHNQNVEFLLISNMMFDPDYISPANGKKVFYESNLSGYNFVLQSLCSKGIINLDMTTLSDQIYKIKKAKDCLTNPLHPNDYLARWYAQGMSALFKKPGF